MVIDFDNDNGCADADWHERTEGMGVAVWLVLGVMGVILGAVAAVVWG